MVSHTTGGCNGNWTWNERVDTLASCDPFRDYFPIWRFSAPNVRTSPSSQVESLTMSDDESSMEWKPASIKEVKEILQEDLPDCDPEQLAVFHAFALEPFAAPIVRNGQTESVIVVARRDNEVIYWEDVECGFNVSPIDENGTILEHWCNQDELRSALNRWGDGRSLPGRI